MRLKSEIWVKGYLRRCAVHGAHAVVARRGDTDAGAIFIKVQRRDGCAMVFSPAPAGREDADYDRRWVGPTDGTWISSLAADAVLERETSFDRDIWVIDVDDVDGRHCLGDDLAS